MIEKLDIKYNRVLSAIAGKKTVYDKDGVEVEDHRFDTFLDNVLISGIDAILYCVVIKDELHVITIYYPSGKSFMSESFTRKYLLGMGVKFIEPELSGAQKYFRLE